MLTRIKMANGDVAFIASEHVVAVYEGDEDTLVFTTGNGKPFHVQGSVEAVAQLFALASRK